MKIKSTYLAFAFMVVVVLFLMFEEEINQLPASVGSLGRSGGINCNRLLSEGSRGEEVKILQKAINERMVAPLAPLELDGVFGPLTAGSLLAITGQTSVSLNQINACP